MALQETLSAIRKALEAEELTVFVGAGMSASVGLPTAPELFRLLRKRDAEGKHIHPNVASLVAAADWCEAREDREWLQSEILAILREEEERFIRTRRRSAVHAILGALSPVEIVTTNWDHLLEYHGIRHVYCLDDAPPAAGDAGSRLLRIHHRRNGFLVASTRDLISYEQSASEWANHLRKVLKERQLLFVGHGLADDWLRRFISEGSLVRTAYAVDPFPDEVKKAVWKYQNVVYVEDDDGLLDATRFFERLAPECGIAVPALEERPALVDFVQMLDSEQALAPTAGYVRSELRSNRRYPRPAVRRILTTIDLGTWIVVTGPAAAGKSTVAMLVAEELLRGARTVKYINSTDLGTDVARVASEVMQLARRDLLILDDMHRNVGPCLELLRQLGDSVCNVLMLTRPNLLQNPAMREMESVRKWHLVTIDPTDDVRELIGHRLGSRGLQAAADEITLFSELFHGDLAALCAGLDAWDGTQQIDRGLAYESMMDRIRGVEVDLAARGANLAPRALLVLAALWQYELQVPASALSELWGIPNETLCALESRGEVVRTSTEADRFVPAFHANTAVLLLKATRSLGAERRGDWLMPDWPLDSDFGFQVLREAIAKDVLSVAKSHDHFVYQGYKHVYVDLLEFALPVFKEVPRKYAELLMNLASAYRRLSSVDFGRADSCLSLARATIAAGLSDPSVDRLQGRLLYEEGYMLYLRNDFRGAATKLHESFALESRRGLEDRKRFAMMSRLQEGISLFRAGDEANASTIIDECLDWFSKPSKPEEWRFRYSSLVWKAHLVASDFPKASTLLQEAAEARDRAEMGSEGAHMNGLKGIVFLKCGQPTRAIHYLRAAIDEARVGTPEGEAQWHYYLGQALEQTLDVSNAKNAYRSAQNCDPLLDNKQWRESGVERLNALSRA